MSEKIINNDLKKKAGGLPSQISDDMLGDIDSAIQGLSGEFLEAIRQQIDDLMPIFVKLKTDPKKMDELFMRAHDIKGQAGTFGYPLITYVGNELCRFIEKIDEPYTQQKLDVIQAHIGTMYALFKNKVTGNGGPVEDKILDGLEKAVEKALQE